jgi:hypothetical protein
MLVSLMLSSAESAALLGPLLHPAAMKVIAVAAVIAVNANDGTRKFHACI